MRTAELFFSQQDSYLTQNRCSFYKIYNYQEYLFEKQKTDQPKTTWKARYRYFKWIWWKKNLMWYSHLWDSTFVWFCCLHFHESKNTRKKKTVLILLFLFKLKIFFKNVHLLTSKSFLHWYEREYEQDKKSYKAVNFEKIQSK